MGDVKNTLHSRAREMAKRSSKYKRCKVCKELVIDIDNCANCAAKKDGMVSPIGRYPSPSEKRGARTLDMQEGNDEGRG